MWRPTTKTTGRKVMEVMRVTWLTRLTKVTKAHPHPHPSLTKTPSRRPQSDRD